MQLSEELGHVARKAAAFAEGDERLSGVLAAEPREGVRVYLCAFEDGEARRTWLALDDRGQPIASRKLVRDAVSITALCEVADETAGGGDLDELSAQLVALRLTERPPGIDEAEDAVRELQRAVGAPPQIASARHLDRVGLAARKLEQAFGEDGSPFAQAMKAAMASVEELAADVESNYKRTLT